MSVLSELSTYFNQGSVDENYDPMSYMTILKDLRNWKQSGGVHSSDFNELDTPGLKFFRVMFHFFNSDESYYYTKGSTSSSNGYGLIHPTWLTVSQSAIDWIDSSVEGRAQELKWWEYSTAYSYLMMNGENDRAQYLRSFIELLSNISTYSPWYFQSINGLDEAIKRTPVNEDFNFKERKSISINCLEDAVDNRIATLLDLYRSATWSWRTKRFIIPSNLRKFDMTIAIIEAPIKSLHHPKQEIQLTDALGMVGDWLQVGNEDYASFNVNNTSNYTTSYKMLEFHNCEIDYSSSASGLETIDNAAGWQPKYKIDIFYDDVEEYSYNEFLTGIAEYGDLVQKDTSMTNYKDNSLSSAEIEYHIDPVMGAEDHLVQNQDVDLENRLDNSTNLLTQVIGGLTSATSNKVDSLIMGNLFGFSLTQAAQELGYAFNGNSLSVLTRAINESNNYNGTKTPEGPTRNIGDDNVKETAIITGQSLGNIFEASTVIRSGL